MYESTVEKCFRLSSCVLSLYNQIDECAEARVLFSSLVEHTSELGAGVSAVNYLPAPEMRAEQSVELVKCAQRVIYLLNLTHREGFFHEKSVSAALTLAVSVANDINGIVQACLTGAAPQGAAAASTAGPIPDGFDMPYGGKPSDKRR